MAELRERALARAAGAATVVQPDAAMRAEVDRRVLQVDRALAARTRALGQPHQRGVVAQGLAPRHVGPGLGQALPLQVAVERHDGVPPDQHRHHDADRVAHVAAIARQVGHQLDEEREQREEDEAPDEGPPRAPALPREQPAGGDQQRQRQREPVAEHTQLGTAPGGVELLLRRLLQHVQALPGRLPGLLRIERGLARRGDALLGGLLGILERVERAGALDQLRVLPGQRGGASCRQPVAEGLARVGAGLRGGVLGELRLRLVARRALRGGVGLSDRGTQRLGGVAIEEVVELQRALDLRQVAHHGAAQADQEAGEHHRHRPQATAEPCLRQTQGPAHRSLPSFNLGPARRRFMDRAATRPPACRCRACRRARDRTGPCA